MHFKRSWRRVMRRVVMVMRRVRWWDENCNGGGAVGGTPGERNDGYHLGKWSVVRWTLGNDYREMYVKLLGEKAGWCEGA